MHKSLSLIFCIHIGIGREAEQSLNHHVTVCSTYGGLVKMSQFQMPENKFEVVSILHANWYYLDASGD
jgi:hypothetical protein